MTRSARIRSLIPLALAAAVAVGGLSGCGPARDAAGTGAANAADSTELGWESQALEAIGFSVADLMPPANAVDPAADPAAEPDATAEPDGRRHPKFKRLRFGFGKRVLHGEAVVQTEEGTKTVVVQRGTVTAIDDNTITVRSADGFTLTWTFGEPIRVIERRTQIEPKGIEVGTHVGVAGAKEGDAPIARLIVVPIKPNK